MLVDDLSIDRSVIEVFSGSLSLSALGQVRAVLEAQQAAMDAVVASSAASH